MGFWCALDPAFARVPLRDQFFSPRNRFRCREIQSQIRVEPESAARPVEYLDPGELPVNAAQALRWGDFPSVWFDLLLAAGFLALFWCAFGPLGCRDKLAAFVPFSVCAQLTAFFGPGMGGILLLTPVRSRSGRSMSCAGHIVFRVHSILWLLSVLPRFALWLPRAAPIWIWQGIGRGRGVRMRIWGV